MAKAPSITGVTVTQDALGFWVAAWTETRRRFLRAPVQVHCRARLSGGIWITETGVILSFRDGRMANRLNIAVLDQLALDTAGTLSKLEELEEGN